MRASEDPQARQREIDAQTEEIAAIAVAKVQEYEAKKGRLENVVSRQGRRLLRLKRLLIRQGYLKKGG